MTELIDRTIDIDAPPAVMWRALRDPVQMKRWMAEPTMELEILTDWAVGRPIVVRGFDIQAPRLLLAHDARGAEAVHRSLDILPLTET